MQNFSKKVREKFGIYFQKWLYLGRRKTNIYFGGCANCSDEHLVNSSDCMLNIIKTE